MPSRRQKPLPLLHPLPRRHLLALPRQDRAQRPNLPVQQGRLPQQLAGPLPELALRCLQLRVRLQPACDPAQLQRLALGLCRLVLQLPRPAVLPG